MGTLDEKKLIVENVKEKINRARSIVILENRGMTVAQATALRSKLREADVDLKVLKNTLVKIAADELGLTGLDAYLQGPTAWAFSMQDPVSAPKILTEYTRTNDKIVVKGGILEKKVITAQGVKDLADLPPREVLLAQVLGAMQGPLVGMANVLQGPIRKLGYALEALRKSKEGAA
mgnify:CR=1 FL=1